MLQPGLFFLISGFRQFRQVFVHYFNVYFNDMQITVGYIYQVLSGESSFTDTCVEK